MLSNQDPFLSIEAKPLNLGVAETNSYVPVDNHYRPLFAQLTRVTNLEEITISLSASQVNISSIAIKDGTSDSLADVVVDGNYNSLRVLTQDLSHYNDSVSIGDGITRASINPATSALYVNVTNSVTVANPITSVNVLNPVSSFTLLNPVTAVTVLNPTVPGFNVPTYTEVDMTYVGSTNNYNTIVYKNGSTVVGTITFTYVGGTPSTNDALVSAMVRTI